MAGNSVMFPAEEHLAFYHAIGMAVTQWAHVENGLSQVALACFAPCRPELVIAGFYSIENFRSKLAFVKRVFQQRELDAELRDEWKTLSKHIEGLSAKRNAVAHGRVIVYPNAAPGRRYAIVPLLWEEPKRKSSGNQPPPGSLCVRDIDLYSKQFSKASARLQVLYSRVQGEESHLAEFAQQEPQPLMLNQLRRQIYAMSPRRAKSSRE